MFYLVIEQGLPFNPSLLKESPGLPPIHGLLFKTGLHFLGLSELFVLFCFFCIQKSSLNKSPQGKGLCDSNLKLNPGMKWHLKLNYMFVYRKVVWLNALGLPRFPCVAKMILEKLWLCNICLLPFVRVQSGLPREPSPTSCSRCCPSDFICPFIYRGAPCSK